LRWLPFLAAVGLQKPRRVGTAEAVADRHILCADAARYHSIYGVYGISVFAVRDATPV
jgi:hypothetical protein